MLNQIVWSGAVTSCLMLTYFQNEIKKKNLGAAWFFTIFFVITLVTFWSLN